jgi:hypothetical protein
MTCTRCENIEAKFTFQRNGYSLGLCSQCVLDTGFIAALLELTNERRQDFVNKLCDPLRKHEEAA